MKKPGNLRSIIVIFFIFVAILGIAITAQFAFENRCYIITCSPASWEKILDKAFAQAEKNFRIDSIIAFPTKGSKYTEEGPESLTIYVGYVSTESDPTRKESDHPEINYPLAYFTFDDRTLKAVTSVTREGWGNYFRSEDSQEKLKKITVTPRNAIRITWTLAKKHESLMPIENSIIYADLIFDDFYIPFFDDMRENGGEPMWIVSYNNKKIGLVYHVNALTGQIIFTSMEEYPE